MYPERIILIGFMGSGKSTVGRLLANELAFFFTDTDEEIEQKTGLTISEIFKNSGEEIFRSYEKEVFQALLKRPGKWVIATGGGLPCFSHLMEEIRQSGCSVYLQASPEIIQERIQNDPIRRPLLENSDASFVLGFIRTKLAERKKIYEQAEVIVNAGNPPREVVQEIRSKIKRPEEE